MSRWFRHYAGMARDDKLVRASIKAKQPVERVVWVWIAILESAAEIDDGGSYEIDHEEIGRFLRCPASRIASVEAALSDLGRIDGGKVAKWALRQFQSDRSAARTKAYRERHRDGDVTSHGRHRDAPDTETETEKSSVDKSTAADAAQSDPDKQFWDSAKSYLGKAKASKIGQWVRDHGRDNTAAAIAAAQVERAVDPVAFVEGRFRKLASAGAGGWESPC